MVKRVSKAMKPNSRPDTAIAAPSSNVVFQDLKAKSGTRASKGAEALRRRIKKERNERWREANGIKRRGKKAANWRREQMAKEMAHERNLMEAVSDESVAEIFSPGVRREFLTKLVDENQAGATPWQESSSSSSSATSPRSRAIPTPSDSELESFLKCEFGHAGFREGQLETIKSVLAGKRSLIVLPTGAGKSLCYQFPSVYLRKQLGVSRNLTIVVSPLIALMTDQLKQLPMCARGAVLHSNMSPTQSHIVYRAIREGEIDLLFVAPERLLMYSMRDVVQSSVFLVAVDEAHCLSEWSHTFRPAYLRIAKMIDFEIRPTALLALTATATLQTVQSVTEVLSITNIVRTDGVVQGGNVACVGGDGLTHTVPSEAPTVQRQNLNLFARRSTNPTMDFLEFLSRPEHARLGPMIVYVQYKWQTEQVSQVLRERGMGTADAYHGGLSSGERTDVHSKFMKNELRFVVATIAFGMGIDKRNVRAVIHLTVPKSVEAYVQESGRCSRDGKPGFCRCYFNLDDYARVRNKSASDSIRRDAVRRVLDMIMLGERLVDDEHDLIVSEDGSSIVYVPECIDSVVSKQHTSLVLSLAEKEGAVEVFHGFPRVIKLRCFGQSIADLAEIDPFVNILWTSPLKPKPGVTTAAENSGVVTVDLMSAVAKSGLAPPLFMHKLSLAQRAQKFAVAKSEWGHFSVVTKKVSAAELDALTSKCFVIAVSSHLLEMNRLDASFALMSRIASESISDEKVGHKLIQQYFEAEQRVSDGEDLVPSILDGAAPGLKTNVLREIDSVRMG